jgi:1-acyl-sn-glycerol-3-phosphate acyltransferase
MLYYVKIFFLVAVLLLHAIFAVAGKILLFFNKRFCILYTAVINKIACIFFSFILGIHITKPQKLIRYKKPVLFVGNHLSYLDILPIGSCYPLIFVTSVDMGEHISEGWITSNAGSVYVERRMDKLTLNVLKKNIESIKSIILKKCALVIFPEATSANGKEDITFFSSLFSAVEYSETIIVPFMIEYTMIDGKALSKENESVAYFYRGERFVPHIKRLLKHGKIGINVSFLKSFSAQDKNRKVICSNCKLLIEEAINN